MDKLKYIHHISDIQIRNLKRHKEYNEVFERTYKEIEKYKDDAVVYIGGDIAHSKTDMSPELIKMLSDLFVNLADICPTILIANCINSGKGVPIPSSVTPEVNTYSWKSSSSNLS